MDSSPPKPSVTFYLYLSYSSLLIFIAWQIFWQPTTMPDPDLEIKTEGQSSRPLDKGGGGGGGVVSKKNVFDPSGLSLV